jgi:hypothetical protein
MTPLNLATFIGDVMGTLQGVVQGNHIYSSNQTTISIMCGLIVNATDHGTPLDALIPLAGKRQNRTHPGLTCRDNSYTLATQHLRNATWGGSMDRQWTYQTCNEFGFYQTAGSEESPFHVLAAPLNVSYYLQQCADAYQPVTTDGSDGVRWTSLPSVPVDFTNSQYGAKTLGSSNTILPDGSLDPWHSLALTQASKAQLALGLTPVIIDGTTHCEWHA